ncbi:MAG: DUF6599 family protein [Terracidiphilus sp.]
MRWMSIAACSMILLGAAASAQAQAAPAKPAGPAQAAAKAVPPPSPAVLLPDSFAGWVAAEPAKTITDPAQADPANAAALKEYDFTDAATASYNRGSDTLSLRALRFHDASGAYGAYSFYRQNGWPKEEIGSGATSNHNRVLFWLGNTLVDANFSHIGPMSGSELRGLASHLPVPGGNRAIAPPILNDLPKDFLDGQTTHYALGPAGYAGAGGVLPPDLVGFDRGAEAVTANYTLRSNPATLTIINYPTPQMAAAQESKIRAYIKAGSQAQPPWPQPLKDSDQASLEVRRSGPLVALISGDVIPDEAHKLLAMFHYDADLTTIPAPPGDSEVAKTAQLLMGIVALVIIGASAAILLGFFLGGGRALYRVARGKPISSVYEEEFIHLDLREEWVEPAPAIDSPHPKG